MTTQTLTDAEIIPARAEGILALRWRALCVEEGRIAPDRTGLDSTAPKDAIAANIKKGLKTQTAILEGIKGGHSTIHILAVKIGKSDSAIRNALSRMEAQGHVKRVGKIRGGRNYTIVWGIS